MPTKTPQGLPINFQTPQHFNVIKQQADQKGILYNLRLVYEKGIVSYPNLHAYDVYSRYSIYDNLDSRELDSIDYKGWKLTFKNSNYEGRNRDYVHYKITDPDGEIATQKVKAEPNGYALSNMLGELIKVADEGNRPSFGSDHQPPQSSKVPVPNYTTFVFESPSKADLKRRIQEKVNELIALQREYLDGTAEHSSMVSEPDPFKENIGARSEAFLYNYLIDLYTPARVKWMNYPSEQFKSYDFIIYDENGNIVHSIDCKGTAKNKRTFYMTGNEWSFFLQNKDKCQVLRVFNVESDMTVYQIDNLYNAITNGEVVPYSNNIEITQACSVVLTIK